MRLEECEKVRLEECEIVRYKIPEQSQLRESNLSEEQDGPSLPPGRRALGGTVRSLQASSYEIFGRVDLR